MDWDNNMDEFHTVEKLEVVEEGRIWHEVCYSKTKFPFPLAPRDCVYNKYINLNPEKGLYFCVWRYVASVFVLLLVLPITKLYAFVFGQTLLPPECRKTTKGDSFMELRRTADVSDAWLVI